MQRDPSFSSKYAHYIMCVEELSNSLNSSDQCGEPTGWELELVTASTSNQGPFTDNKLVSLFT